MNMLRPILQISMPRGVVLSRHTRPRWLVRSATVEQLGSRVHIAASFPSWWCQTKPCQKARLKITSSQLSLSLHTTSVARCQDADTGANPTSAQGQPLATAQQDIPIALTDDAAPGDIFAQEYDMTPDKDLMHSKAETLKFHKGLTPGQRGKVSLDYRKAGLWRGRPFKPLTLPKKKTGGRDNRGRITCRHRGGGAKQRYRIIDFKRQLWGVPATVERLEYDPNRSAFISLLSYEVIKQAAIHHSSRAHLLTSGCVAVGPRQSTERSHELHPSSKWYQDRRHGAGWGRRRATTWQRSPAEAPSNWDSGACPGV